jgi:hypothetical protein
MLKVILKKMCMVLILCLIVQLLLPILLSSFPPHVPPILKEKTMHATYSLSQLPFLPSSSKQQ